MRKEKPNKPHSQKVKTIGLSVIIAVIIWLMVIVVYDPVIKLTLKDIDVRFTNETALREKNLVIVNKDKIPELSAVVMGSRSDIFNSMDSVHVQVDVGNIEGTGIYEVSGSVSVPYSRISVEKENFDVIPVSVESLEAKEIEVTVKQTGSRKDKLIKSIVNEPKIAINGASSEVNKIAGAVAVVDISNMTEDTTESVGYVFVDEAGNVISKSETVVSSRSKVDVINTVYDIKTLPVVPMLTAEMDREYILKTDKTTITPETVTVGADPSDTEDKLIVYIEEMPQDGSGEYEISHSGGLYIPEGSKKVKIKTEIVKKAVAQLELSVEAENVGEGLNVRIDDKLIAQVWGEEGKISTDTVKAVVDVTGLDKGTYNLPVKAEGQNVGFQENYTVNVTIE